jgi:hypothetical protein
MKGGAERTIGYLPYEPPAAPTFDALAELQNQHGASTAEVASANLAVTNLELHQVPLRFLPVGSALAVGMRGRPSLRTREGDKEPPTIDLSSQPGA